MSQWNRTSREVDGESVVGSWRHAFINNGGSYFLTDLIVYADGVVDCWGLVTLEEFRDKLRDGWVATTLKEGAHASAHELASWTFKDVQSWVGADELYTEVVDQVEALNGRLDSSDRCLEALDVFLAEQTDANGKRLAAAYNDIPKHRRRYILSDMDAKDGPLRVLTTPVGAKLAGRVVTADQRAQALGYFAERQASRQKAAERTPPVAPAVVVPGSFHHEGWPDPPGILALHTQYPAPVRIGDDIYPTVEHAYWALRTTDRAVRDAVLAEPNPYGLSRIASESPARPGWEASLQATIAQLLRAKFQQHETLAAELLLTGGGRIVFDATGFGDTYAYGSRRHLIGRLLELVRAEQQAWRSGLIDLGSLDSPSNALPVGEPAGEAARVMHWLDEVVLPLTWHDLRGHDVDDEQRREHLAAELRRELGVDHQLTGKGWRVVAAATARDDALLALTDGTAALVHLTYASTAPERPPWPMTVVLSSERDLEVELLQRE